MQMVCCWGPPPDYAETLQMANFMGERIITSGASVMDDGEGVIGVRHDVGR
jgi:hypothetical protein